MKISLWQSGCCAFTLWLLAACGSGGSGSPAEPVFVSPGIVSLSDSSGKDIWNKGNLTLTLEVNQSAQYAAVFDTDLVEPITVGIAPTTAGETSSLPTGLEASLVKNTSASAKPHEYTLSISTNTGFTFSGKQKDRSQTLQLNVENAAKTARNTVKIPTKITGLDVAGSFAKTCISKQIRDMTPIPANVFTLATPGYTPLNPSYSNTGVHVTVDSRSGEVTINPSAADIQQTAVAIVRYAMDAQQQYAYKVFSYGIDFVEKAGGTCDFDSASELFTR